MVLIESPDIAGVGYQKGLLSGYDLGECIIEKHNRASTYCGHLSKDSITHLLPPPDGRDLREEE